MTVVNPVPGPVTSLGGVKQFLNMISLRTVITVEPGSVPYAVTYGGQYRGQKTDLGNPTSGVITDSQALGFADGSYDGHSDWVQVRFRAANAAGTWGAYGPWIDLDKMTQ